LEGKLTEADADGRQPSLPVRLLNRVSLKYVLLILGGLFLVPWPTPPKFAPLTFSYGGREFTGQAYWNFSLMQLDEKLTREDGGKTSVLVVDGDIYGSPRTKLYVWIFPNPRPLTDRILPKFDSFRNPAPREAIKIDGAEIVHFYIKSDLDTGPVSEITAIRARNAGIGDRKLIIEKDAEGRLANYKFDDNGATRILIGLSSRNEDMKFNETNIRDADYIVFDLKYANGTTGSITVRKNRNDSENIEKAFSAWKNAF
jgi:hypothetical protein